MLDSQNSITQYRKKMPVTESHNDVAYSQLEKSFPVQLELFQAHRYLRAKKTDYSRSIAVYDQLPKHHHGRQHHLRQVTHNGLREVLPDIVREPCVIGGIAYNLRIRPARVDVLTQTDGETKRVTRDIYPGPREELVEEVIRKLSLQEGNISYVRLGGMQAVAVTFTLSDIESELSQNGHTYSRAEIKEALHVCRNCELNVTWTDQNGKRMDHSAPIFLQAVLGGDNDSHHVVFHPFVTDSIDQISWRITNYELLMSHRSPLTRWLHRRLNHQFVYADLKTPYTIKLSTILRDSGTLLWKYFRQNRRSVEDSLDELVAAQIIQNTWKDTLEETKATQKKPAGGRPRITDVKYHLMAHESFVQHAKLANTVNKLTSSAARTHERMERQ